MGNIEVRDSGFNNGQICLYTIWCLRDPWSLKLQNYDYESLRLTLLVGGANYVLW